MQINEYHLQQQTYLEDAYLAAKFIADEGFGNA